MDIGWITEIGLARFGDRDAYGRLLLCGEESEAEEGVEDLGEDPWVG